MKITATEEYGMRCMMRLAQRAGETVSITELAAAERIAVPFAAKVLLGLRRAGLVAATRGRNGGYRLTADPTEMTVGRILRALGKPLFDAGFCRQHGATAQAVCSRLADCSLRPVWSHLDLLLDAFFANTTLADLLAGETRTNAHLDARWPRPAPAHGLHSTNNPRTGETRHVVNR